MKTISIGFSKRAEIRGIDFMYKIDPKIPTHFNTDPRRLTQILNNLIGNSMKFTFEGYVKVEVEQVTISDRAAIKVSIHDTGLGIKEEDQKSIFRLFTSLDITKNINKSGTGIGLYQSQKFARKLGFPQHNGIQVQSKWQKGTTFSFILEDKNLEMSEEYGPEVEELN